MREHRTIHRAAKVRTSTYDPDARTIEVVWSTGAAVNRSDWDGDFVEALCMDPGAIRLGRLNAGAPLLDTHDSSELSRVIGSVVPGSARIEDGKGLATVRLSAAKGVADAVTKIAEGSIRNISVGYWIHAQTETEANGVRTITATDWEPLEISAVPVPADPGAQFRSAHGRRSAPSARARAIRRYAAAARMPKLGEQHVRKGTSASRFWDLVTARLTGGNKEATMSKHDQDQRDYAAGRRSALKLLGRGTKRDEDEGKKPPEDEDEDRDEDLVNSGADDDEDEAGDKGKKKDPEAERQAGERYWLGLARKSGMVGMKRNIARK